MVHGHKGLFLTVNTIRVGTTVDKHRGQRGRHTRESHLVTERVDATTCETTEGNTDQESRTHTCNQKPEEKEWGLTR